ncbi:hypothetical protein [Mycoplasmopsis felis]|uniref:Uncharacterized protein n=1 Tax=Mycoplasmopsis felis TaxID=33923 RepID=A0A809SEB4_9BACT|nr:hypothetical protein [Mycoplasmopsis felis]WQQ02598.1 hypothetical protein RNN91_00760 [Mycoplasmopsis felis]WQQ08556.1 hypothetical protein RRG61_00350 [Mycoplasmopsis felis]WQQ09782.1 hypothetical protein RRG49_02270 [Mycoplasmopsis felis]WRX06952.1 hypothetical protein O7984_01630 [Mycoplasmopsis felis]BBU47749.1 hypothetical protein JPM2_4420 [Mycoplasmopsis felis]
MLNKYKKLKEKFWTSLFLISWKKTLNFTIQMFKELNIVKNIELQKEWFLPTNKKWKNIEDFATEFLSHLTFFENINPLQEKMIQNFYNFMFYQAKYKKNRIQYFSLNKIINTHDYEIDFNHKKRLYYYDFLDEFQKIPHYNVYLIKILKRIL